MKTPRHAGTAEPASPVLTQCVNLWTLVGHPPRRREWTLERKLRAVQEAGFDGVADRLTRGHARWCDRLGLMRVGLVVSNHPREFRDRLEEQRDGGATRVNVILGAHDTSTSAALRLVLRLMREGERLRLEVSVETHRDSCTETPEKLQALVLAYRRATGGTLRLTWDFSHHAVVKHLLPPFWPRFAGQARLIRAASQFHFRPFNGHHCQVPVMDARGRLTPELRDYLPFMEQVMRTWLAGAAPGAEMVAVPELGPLWMGYNLHSFPPSWSQAMEMRRLIERSWRRCLAEAREP
jgi:hypothetical protein